jgi:hypothetical protein
MDADAGDDDAVESELNHTPMERNKDLKEEEDVEEPLLRPRAPPLSDSGRDHAGLRGHHSCSGARLPDPDPDPDDDDGARKAPRRSRPAMLCGPQWLAGRRDPVSRRALPPASAANNNNITRGKASLGRGSRPCPRSRPELRRGRGATGLTWQPTCPSSRDRDGDRDREEEAVATPSSPRTLKQPAGPRRLLNSMETSKGPQRAATTVPVACTCGCGHGWLALACSTSPYQPWRSRFLGTIPSLFSLWKQAYNRQGSSRLGSTTCSICHLVSQSDMPTSPAVLYKICIATTTRTYMKGVA